MTPEEVIEAIFNHDVEAIRSAATAGFREHVPAEELRRVFQSVRSPQSVQRPVGASLVLHDVELHLEAGQFHVQIAYEGEAIAGLVIKPGPPTGRFGE